MKFSIIRISRSLKYPEDNDLPKYKNHKIFFMIFNCSKEETLVNLWKCTKTLGLGALHSDYESTKEEA